MDYKFKIFFPVLLFTPGVRTLYAEIEIIYDRERESSESFTVHLSQDKFMIAEVKVCVNSKLPEN